MIDRRAALRGLVILGLATTSFLPGCGVANNPTNTETQQSSSPKRLPKGEAFDKVLDLVSNHRLVYQSMQSRTDFLTDLAAYRKSEGRNSPCSMVFTEPASTSRLQIAYCDAFSGETFQFMATFDNGRVEATICAPSTLSKRYAYRNLTDGFQHRQQASREILMYLAGGGSPDCVYYVNETEKERRSAPNTGRPKG